MSSQAYILWAILLLMLCSILTRVGYFLFGDYLPLTPAVRRSLRFAPVAALIAIVVPELFPLSGAYYSTEAIIKIISAVLAVLIFLRTRNALHLMLGGMVCFWVLKALLV
ncbi:MAG TPA: AzlD domain-containing protein [Paenalcaligenes sp.]|nr:AzlD domain-containing protein [Paenalcaligenes sp.]